MTDHLLTKKKKQWVARFKPNVLRGTTLHYNDIDAKRYQLRLERLIDQMVDDTEKELTALFNSQAASNHFGQDDSVASQARIITNGLSKKFDQLFNRKAKGLAMQMVEGSKASSRSTLSSSLKQLSGGLTLKTDIMTGNLSNVLKATVAENVGLIQSIPEQYLSKVQGAVMRSITTGNGLADLIPFLEKHRMITKKRARMIAYDQTRKAYNGINKARMDAIGIQKAEWIHSGGSNEPRPTHVKMDGIVFNLNEGLYDSAVGEYIQPGQLPNCRCTYRPIVDFDEQPDD